MKSPLRGKSLRNPGQGLDEELQILDDQAFPYFWFPATFILLVAMAWLAYLADFPRQPVAYTIAAAVMAAIGGARLIQIRKQVRKALRHREGPHRRLADFHFCSTHHEVTPATRQNRRIPLKSPNRPPMRNNRQRQVTDYGDLPFCLFRWIAAGSCRECSKVPRFSRHRSCPAQQQRSLITRRPGIRLTIDRILQLTPQLARRLVVDAFHRAPS